MLLIVSRCCHLLRYFNAALCILHGFLCANVRKIPTNKALEKVKDNGLDKMGREQIQAQLRKSYAVVRVQK